MSFEISLLLENPIQPTLEMPRDALLWQRCEALNDSVARWQVYLHQLAWNTLLPWLQEECQAWTDSAIVYPQLWPAVGNAGAWSIWQVVEGLVFTLGQRRIVAMVSEAVDTAELRVPKEWVDTAAWAADYYLAVRVAPDEQYLSLWGYATHAQLKTRASYDDGTRTYCLLAPDVIQDFSAFWVAQKLEALTTRSSLTPAKTPAEAFAEILTVQADNLCQRLAIAAEPRLQISFAQWTALLSSAQWRRSLYEQRQQSPLLGKRRMNLGRWASEMSRQLFDVASLQLAGSGWYALSDGLSSEPKLASNFRSEATLPPSVVGKAIVLNTPTETISLLLVVAVTIEDDERRNIRVQLYPAMPSADRGIGRDDAISSFDISADAQSSESLLPEAVMLSLHIPDAEAALQTVSAGPQDNYIQLSPFRCPAALSFSVEVACADALVTEDFVS